MEAKESIDAAGSILEEVHEGALGTLEENKPFVSAAGFIFIKEDRKDKNGSPDLGGSVYLLLSELARHTRHLKKNAGASLLVMEKNSRLPVYERKRFSLQGIMQRVEDLRQCEILKARYLEVFPNSAVFFTLSDFHFYHLRLNEIYWIGGFGKIASLK